MIRRRLGELQDKFGSKPVVVVTEKVSRYQSQIIQVSGLNTAVNTL